MCLKTADVHFVRMEKMSGGIVSIVIKGDVAAVTSGIASGVEAAKRLGGYRRHTIIARVDHQTEELLYRGKLIRENAELKKSAAKDIAQEKDDEGEDVRQNQNIVAEAVQSSETPEGPAVSDPVEESKLVSMELHEEALVAMSVPELRRLARQINIKTMDKDTIKRARKADLIMNILSGYKEREE
ncbi:MAG: BMC domain-containing protein [Clostridia bacterium]|nr:BMC domain-containing protein [Clostridia bacterium]